MEITIRDVTYTVEEATVGEMIPIMDLMQEDPKAFQTELIKRVVKVDGVPIGEDLNNLPLSVYMKLIPHVMDMQGFGDEGK